MKKLFAALLILLLAAVLGGLFYLAVAYPQRACEFGPCLPGPGILED
jgi:hypothetical protein